MTLRQRLLARCLVAAGVTLYRDVRPDDPAPDGTLRYTLGTRLRAKIELPRVARIVERTFGLHQESS